MRRPVIYIAGLLLATGASLALAGPASAAPSHKCHKAHHNGGWDQGSDHEYNRKQLYLQQIKANSNAQNDGNYYGGLLNLPISLGGSGDGGLIGGGILG